MENLKKLLMLTLVIVLLPIVVFADGNVAKVNGTEYDTIEKAMTAAEGTEYEVVLLQDVTLANRKVVTKDLAIDLNGHSIKYTSLLFEVYGAEFTVKGTGTLEETTPDYTPIAIYGSKDNDANFKSVVNVGEGVTLKGWSGIMVREYGKYSQKTEASDNSYGVEVNFAGKIISVLDTGNGTGSGIYVNGKIKHIENAPVVNIKKTADITSMGVGILIAGYANVTVEGGKIVGDESGIEVRAGELVVLDGTIESTATKLEVIPNNNGSTTIGAGIAVAQHTTVNKLNVEVKGGNISGYVAFNEANPENNTQQEVEEIKLDISGGIFETTNTAADAKAVASETQTEFVKGGKYNATLSENLIIASATTKVENGIVKVLKENKVNVEDSKNGTVKVDKNIALEGDTVTITATPEKGYEVDKIVVEDVQGKSITVTDGKFTMGEYEVGVTVTFKKVEVKEDATEKDNSGVNESIPETPKTGDNVLMYVVLGFASIGGIYIALNSLKKRRFN